MRGFLVLVGILITLAVAFLVAWPSLVDVSALRGELARIVRESGGSEVRIAGAMRLELLPWPRFVIERAVIGDRIEVGPRTRFAADRIDVELAPLPLLAGRIEPSGLQLVRPRLELAELSPPLAPALLRALSAGPLAGVRRIDIVDGSLHLGEGAEAILPDAYDAVDLVARRDGEQGFRLDGSAAVAGEPLRLSVSGAPTAIDAPVDLTLRVEAGPRDASASFEFSGRVTPGSRAEGRLRLSTEQGPLPRWLMGDMALSGTLTARLTASPLRLELADLELRSAEGELRGAATVDLAERTSFDLTLEGVELTATPGLIAAGHRLLSAASRLPGLSGRAGLQLASLIWRGAPVRRLRVEAGLTGAARPELRRLDAMLPGQAALSWVGSQPPADALLAGELSLQAGELRPLLAWLGLAQEDLPAGGLTSLDLIADAAVGTGRLSLRRIRARLDASQVEGSVDYAGSPRPRVELALTADRVNTALYQAPPTGWANWRSRLESLDGTLDLAVDRLSHDILRGRGFRLRAALDGGRLDLPELRVADLAGVGLTLAGAVDLALGAWDLGGTLASSDPKLLLRLLRFEPPPEIDRLDPLRLEAQSRRETGITSLDLEVTAGDATASLSGQLMGQPVDGALDLALTAGAPDTGALLLALGWPAPVDRPDLGSLTVTGRARRDGGPVEVTIDAKAGENALDAALALDPQHEPPRLGGTIRAPRLDTALLAAIYETLALSLQFPPGSPWFWPGDWPDAPLGWEWLGRLDLDLALEVAGLRHEGVDRGAAAFTVQLADRSLALRRMRLPLAGGTLSGSATLEGRRDHALVGAQLRLAGARIEDLAAATAPGSTIRGALNVDASLLGQGRSIADLVGSLSGTGQLELRDARLTSIQVGAASGPAAGLEAADLSGPFALSGGTLISTAPGLDLSYPAGNATVELRLDLLAWILDARIASSGITHRFLGPPGRIHAVAPP